MNGALLEILSSHAAAGTTVSLEELARQFSTVNQVTSDLEALRVAGMISEADLLAVIEEFQMPK